MYIGNLNIPPSIFHLSWKRKKNIIVIYYMSFFKLVVTYVNFILHKNQV
jgi:hypothetical protein